MGRLVIDGNSFFEIDEECLKRRKVSRDCDLEKYIKNEEKQERLRIKNDKKKGDG